MKCSLVLVCLCLLSACTPHTKESPYDPAKMEIDRHVNVRFGFTVEYPAYWDRRDSESSDGSSFVDPKNPLASFSAWGSHNAANLNSIYELMEEEKEFILHSEWKDECIMEYESESGKYAMVKNGEKVYKTNIPGYRMRYTCSEAGVSYTYLKTFCMHDDIIIEAQGQCPSGQYEQYEDLFLILTSSLTKISPGVVVE